MESIRDYRRIRHHLFYQTLVGSPQVYAHPFNPLKHLYPPLAKDLA